MPNHRKPTKGSKSTRLKAKKVPYYLLKPIFSFAKREDAERALKIIREALTKEFGYPVFEGDPSELEAAARVAREMKDSVKEERNGN